MRIIAVLLAISSLLVECRAQSPPLDRLLFEDVDAPTEVAPGLDRVPPESHKDVAADSAPSTVVMQLRTVKKRLNTGELGPTTLRLQQQILASLEAMKDAAAYTELMPNANASDVADDAVADSITSNQGSQAGSSDGTAKDTADGSLEDIPDGLGAAEGDWRKGREKLLEKTWGHLPPATLEQIRAGSSAQFLPEFREQIESYFKRLADLPTDDQ